MDVARPKNGRFEAKNKHLKAKKAKSRCLKYFYMDFC